MRVVERRHVPGYEFLDGLSSDENRFRESISRWLEQHLVGPYAEARGLGGPADETAWDIRAAWEKELARDGWRGLAIPRRYGGREATYREQLIFAREYALAEAPYRPGAASEELFAPTVLLCGTEDQKRRFIPPILAADCYWAQGFSEPDAGSDLASVKTRASIDGEHWVVHGQKIWTTFGHYAAWIYVLCRTDPAAPKHRGLSMLLMPLDQPAIEIRPIRTMAGNADFCEVFFDGARTTADLVLGDVGSGWQVAMTLLSIERGTSMFSYQMTFQREIEDLIAVARCQGLSTDPIIRQRIARIWSELRLLDLQNQRILNSLVAQGSVGAESSSAKLFASQWHKRLGELCIDVLAMKGQLVGDDYHLDPLQKLYLLSRAETIYGGSQEIQRNLLGERVLGLPR